jgi:hypothetical protein
LSPTLAKNRIQLGVRYNCKWGTIDLSAHVSLDAQLDDVDVVGNSEIRARVLDRDFNSMLPAGGFAIASKGWEFIFINALGQIAFKDSSADALPFSNQLAAVRPMGIFPQYGYIDTHGKMVIAPQFDLACPFHDGLACVKQLGKWGVINAEGKYVLKPAYDKIEDFHEGYAVYHLGDSVGT